jgi:hypothetical protein
MPSLSLVAREERSPQAEAMSESLYVWQVYESGMWGTIAIVLAEMTAPGNFLVVGIEGNSLPVPLISRSRQIATEFFREHAIMHHQHTDLPVRLVRMEPAETLELLPHAEG